MDVIEIDCPRCNTPLELDSAFAGGVCRCSECGTLMAVPADSSQQVETLARPDAPAGDRPDSPGAAGSTAGGGRPDAPGAPSGGRPDAPRAERPDAPGGSGIAPPPGSTAIAGADTADLDALASTTGATEVYVTPSGRTIHVNKHSKVPTAKRKRKVIRATAIVGMIALTAALVIGIILFTNALFGTKDNDDTPKKLIGLDPDVNPLMSQEVNILGIPMGGDVALLIDGSGFSSDWIAMMRDVIYDAVERSPGTQFLVIAWTDAGDDSFTKDKPAKIAKEDLGKFRRFLDIISPIAPAFPGEAVKTALELRMDQIVLISGQHFDESRTTAIKEGVEAKIDTRFDVILITDAGDHDPGLEAIAKANKGKYHKVTTRQLEAWYNAWKDKKSGAGTQDDAN